MPNATWKEHERRTAQVLGGRRVGPTGREGPDVVVGDPPWLCVECKQRATLPAWLKDALAQARAAAGTRRLGIAVLHEKGKHDSMVVLNLATLQLGLEIFQVRGKGRPRVIFTNRSHTKVIRKSHRLVAFWPSGCR